jgi:hypothetical protein
VLQLTVPWDVVKALIRKVPHLFLRYLLGTLKYSISSNFRSKEGESESCNHSSPILRIGRRRKSNRSIRATLPSG